MTKTDLADDHLLDLLRQDARQSTAALARKLGVARSTVQSRLERLERTGVIAGYTLKPGAGRGDRRVTAHVMIAVAPQQQAAVERKLRAVRGVKSLLTVSGTYDFIAVVTADTTDELDQWLDELRACEGVQQTLSSIILSTRLER
jgi:DNA-binding Lrp family transcriptional regulator